MIYKTRSQSQHDVQKTWVLVDVKNSSLGRSCSVIAKLLRGKHKPNYTPHVDMGDNVVVINAAEISLGGNNWDQKRYIRHTGYPGGQKSLTAKQVHTKNPTRLLEKAVKGMLPKNRLGAELFRNLRVYPGAEHKQHAQNPKKIDLSTII